MSRKPNQMLFLVLAVLSSCSSRDEAATELPPVPEAGSPSSRASPTIVTTAMATFKAVASQVQGNGRIQSGYEEEMVAQSGGQLVACIARNGRRVRKGETIAALETTTLELRKEKLLIQQYNAEKEYESQLLGYEGLLKGKSSEEASAVKRKLRAATGLAALEVDLRELQHEIATASVKASVDGILADVKITGGMYVRPGQELFRIYSDRELYLEIKVLETEIAMLRIGQMARVFPLADKAKPYTAHVAEISPRIDENGMALVRLKLTNPGGLLLGMNAAAEVTVPHKRGLVVPREALVVRSGKPVVFTLDKGLAKWNYVKTGLDNGREVEILEGIREGETVIISNNLQLAHDAPVKVVN